NILQRNGVLPVPPPELQNRELNVEYVSILAQAQRLVNTGAIDRVTQFTGGVAAIWPEARHKININRSIDEYAEALGVDPSLIVSDSDANAAAAAEAQAQQRQAMMEQGAQAVDMAKKASETNIDDDSMLGRTMANAGVSQ
ncbi:MAG: phage tail protein, partial [Gammaproteobacteria bacterium]|nr:phage tail protein [Gammaproteobacteria bacterium]